MTDLRDRLHEFNAAAQRILSKPPRLALVHARPAKCHPTRPCRARGLCDPCYNTAWQKGTLDQHALERTYRRRVDFVADYTLLRSEGYNRGQIAERLGMKYDTVTRAYRRAVDAGLLTPDRRTA